MLPSLSPFQFSHTEAALATLLRFDFPADGELSRYFRAHRALGHTDRGAIAENVYAVLRRLRSLEARCRLGAEEAVPAPRSPRRLLLAAHLDAGRNLRELEPLTRATEREWLAAAKGFSVEGLSPAEALDLPDWLHERLLVRFGAEETVALATALNRPAPLDLRVNTLKTNRKTVLEQLRAEGLAAEAGHLSPLAIRIRGDKPALARHPLFTSGAIEVQDEGSQLLGILLDPKRGEMAADFCAGAGGKTLLLGTLMRNTGRLYAFDVSEKRLAKLKPRLQRSGLSNVYPQRLDSEHDVRIKRLAGKLDKVLIDAPCSGLGTLRRNPDLKWRQTPESVTELSQKQARILAAAATLLRPGGCLVYATCSLLTEENDAIVDAFLAAHPGFTEISASTALRKRCDWPESEPRLKLLPHRHGTDGFFAALLEKQGAGTRSATSPE
ncbi:MAG: RsmB/NOP family class I SAM-dependent RNA methyltransferase [Zoogloeaceae bacterium]|nr:RsmB/NOP family class I SAM-dependent RNA methyltransferase [Zoogloeaceae bacterium]